MVDRTFRPVTKLAIVGKVREMLHHTVKSKVQQGLDARGAKFCVSGKPWLLIFFGITRSRIQKN